MRIYASKVDEDAILSVIAKHMGSAGLEADDRYHGYVTLDPNSFALGGVRVDEAFSKAANYPATKVVRELRRMGYEASDQGLFIGSDGSRIRLYHTFIVR